MPHTKIVRKRFRLDELFSDISESSSEEIDPDWLVRRTRWIRDDLDPMISRHGPAWLQPDQVVEVFKFLDDLRRAKVTIESIRASRIHLAVAWIAGTATRWPQSVLDIAEKLLKNWTVRYGPLSEIGLLLYDEGGRLHGISQPSDISKEMLEVRWHKAPGSRTADGFARKHGDLAFAPGDWWINTMFAYHDSIVDSGIPTSHIICDKQSAYALVLNEWDELDSHDPDQFTYRARSHETGRFRLTAGTPASRQPIRVLRSHSLRSFWAPQAGVRYDGLYKVSGWSVKQDIRSKAWTYHISFRRQPGQRPMTEVLRHPLAHELDDYTEYKRIRQLERLAQSVKPVHEATRSPGPAMKRPNAPTIKFAEEASGQKSPTARSVRTKPGLVIDLPTPPVVSNLQLDRFDVASSMANQIGTPAAISPVAQTTSPTLKKPSPARTPLLGLMTHLTTLFPVMSPGQAAKKPSPGQSRDGDKRDDYFSISPTHLLRDESRRKEKDSEDYFSLGPRTPIA